MIGKLTGVIDSLGEDELVLDVAGVGYVLVCGARALSRVETGASVVMHVETYVREDVFRLYGFLTEAERAWFVRLQSVQGVGAKHALAMLDALSPGEVESAAALGDAAAFERAKGVGKKLAQRIAAELKDKAPPAQRRKSGETLAAALAPSAPASGPSPAAAPEFAGTQAARDGAVSALVNLGYGESEARQAAAAALRVLGDEADEARLIRQALKELAR